MLLVKHESHRPLVCPYSEMLTCQIMPPMANCFNDCLSFISYGLASSAEVPSRSRYPPPACLQTIQRLVRNAGFSREVAKVAAVDLQSSTASLYQSKWSWFLSWCHQQDIDPCKASIPWVAEFFLYLCHHLVCLFQQWRVIRRPWTTFSHWLVWPCIQSSSLADIPQLWEVLPSAWDSTPQTGTFLLFCNVCLGLLPSPWSQGTRGQEGHQFAVI